MNQIVNRQGTAIGSELLTKLKSGIAESRSNTVIAGGKPILRLLKDNQWVFGQQDNPVQLNSIWAVNPLSIAHGWVCWSNYEGNQKNSVLGEVMEPVHAAKPARPAPVDGFQYNEQRIFDLRCLDGDDEGEEVVYKVSSLGGLRACDALLAALQQQLDDNPMYPCPVVEMLSSNYQHPKHGKIYEPVFTIVDWATMDGKLLSEQQPELAAPAPAPAAEPAPAPTPTRRTRAAAAPAPAAAPAEPEPTARRRPIRR